MVTLRKLRILQRRLNADKHSGRDWWIKHGALTAFNESRRPPGRLREAVEASFSDEALDRKRKYEREYRRYARTR